MQILELNPAAIPLSNSKQEEISSSAANWNTPLRSAIGSELLRVTLLYKEAMEQGEDVVDQQEDDLDAIHTKYAVNTAEY